MTMDENNHQLLVGSQNIKYQMAEEDRPREKALKRGFDALTNRELLAILLRSGVPGQSVVSVCDEILKAYNNKLYTLARVGVKELTRFNGVGEVKAITLLAALELARRFQLEQFDEEFQVRTSADAYNYLRPVFEHLSHEELWVLLLNRNKNVMGRQRVSSGGTAMTVGDVKMILKPAIEQLADGIILAHNHPSDNPTPSQQDNMLTHHVAEACRVMDIQLVDHIVVCRGGRYYSYGDHDALR